MMRVVLLTIFMAGCSLGPAKCAPKEPHGPSCADVGAHVKELGGCGFPEGKFASYCADAESAQQEIRRSLNLECMNAALDCKEFEACR